MLVDAVPGLRQAVVTEFRRVARPPWEIPTALVTNGVLMVAAWFLLPPRARAFLSSLPITHARSAGAGNTAEPGAPTCGG